MSRDEAVGNDTPESDDLDLEIRRLERKKLRAEIAQLALPWWKRAGFIGSLTPIIVALIALFAAFAAGYFDDERQRLKNDIVGLENKKDDLQRKIDGAYLRLRIASNEAEYTLINIRQGTERNEDTELLLDLVGDVETELRKLPGILENIQPSDWAKELTPVSPIFDLSKVYRQIELWQSETQTGEEFRQFLRDGS